MYVLIYIYIYFYVYLYICKYVHTCIHLMLNITVNIFICICICTYPNIISSPFISLSTQNGGKYNFHIGEDIALPNSSSFWQFLMSSSRDEWRLTVYEQDWLDFTEEFLTAAYVHLSMNSILFYYIYLTLCIST